MTNIAFLFSGQGAQTPGMGKSLYDNSAAAKKVFAIADSVLGRRISEICFYGTQEELNLTHNTQPCMLAVDLAAYAAISEHNIKPQAAAGFSLGEYAALAAAGVISLEDAFRLVQLRADAMQEAVPVGEGAMATFMNLSPAEVESLCREVEGYVIPANYNSPGQTVVSGEAAAVKELIKKVKARGIKAVRLPVSAPFHCELMKPAKDKLAEAFETVTWHNADVPIYMNIDGKPHTRAEDIKQCVLRQTVSPVRWTDTIENMYADYNCYFLELGVGETLCHLVEKIKPDVLALSVEDIVTMQDFLRRYGS